MLGGAVCPPLMGTDNYRDRGGYHQNTFVYYGADALVPSYETVRWKMKRGVQDPDGVVPPTIERVRNMGFPDVMDDGSNPLYIGAKIKLYPSEKRYEQFSQWEIWAEQQDSGGDGTVPVSSGQSPLKHSGNPSHIRQQFGLVGFEHEESYRDAGAQLVTLHCIQKIAAEATFPS